MKLRAVSWSMVLVALAFATPHTFAQDHGGIEAKIPFEFMVGEKLLEPGEYHIDVASLTEPGVLTLRRMDTGERVMLDTEQLPEKDDPRSISLVFDKIRDHFYLMEVWGVENSGRGVKHLVDGEVIERASRASRARLNAIDVVSPQDQKSGG